MCTQGTGLKEYSQFTYRLYSLSQSEAGISISVWGVKNTPLNLFYWFTLLLNFTWLFLITACKWSCEKVIFSQVFVFPWVGMSCKGGPIVKEGTMKRGVPWKEGAVKGDSMKGVAVKRVPLWKEVPWGCVPWWGVPWKGVLWRVPWKRVLGCCEGTPFWSTIWAYAS